MKKTHLIILSCLSGILFTVGWPVNGFPAFLFVALVPLLIIEQHISENKENFSKFSIFFYTYPAFFIWNFLTTWWIWNSTPVATMAWLLNSLFMSIVFHFYHVVRKNVYSEFKGYFVLPFLWITFEFIHLNWKLTWSWLSLGHGFATYIEWIQWYEYTGILGGTLWIVIINILIFHVLKPGKKSRRSMSANGGLAFVLLIIPILISYIIYYTYEEESNTVRIIVVQPNIDPYTEQYTLPALEAIDRNLDLAEKLMDDQVSFIVSPESAIQEDIWEGNMEWSPVLRKLTAYTKENPNLNIVIGASTYRRILEGEKIPSSARYHSKLGFFYDRFNTALLIDSTGQFQKHHKSKLTPGVEYMPSWGPFSFLENMAIDLGGTVGSLGTDKEQVSFVTIDSVGIAPLICYESAYGEFTNKFVKKGANVIFVITNDGWWGDTPGHKQHLYFSPLRAIETRRSVARSANTGISCFVDQRGNIFQATKYWEPDVIKQDLNLNAKITFYTRMGDYIGRISTFLAVIFILLSIVFGIRKRKRLPDETVL